MSPYKNGEPVFALRGQDKLAPHAIRAWAHSARIHGVSNGKVSEAMEIAERMEQWQKTNEAKLPD